MAISQTAVHLVWYKRDLRVTDHTPLATALTQAADRNGTVLPLHVIEPLHWSQPEADLRHWLFVRDCLRDLRARLRDHLNLPLIIRYGSMPEVLLDLHHTLPIDAIYAHQEVGPWWSWQRDKAVTAWARNQGVTIHETPTDGVVRGRLDRDHWASGWERQHRAPPPALPPPPSARAVAALAGLPPGDIPEDPLAGHAPAPWDHPVRDRGLVTGMRQRGGETEAQRTLTSFLAGGRGQHYHKHLSSPLTAETGCSRLSAHLAWGSLSMRQVIHASRSDGANSLPPVARRAFEERLHWRGHFMQKLESRPEMEWAALHPAMGTLSRRYCPDRFTAWAEGRTGFPFADACMRALTATGWINFRMRAMLVSLATHVLWLPWQPVARHLAGLFTDYEPGIHFPQVQMQASTTGINLPRIYNPLKQGQDQDPDGLFTRRWLPELTAVDPAVPLPLHAETGLGLWSAQTGYPAPIVNRQQAARAAREAISLARTDPMFRAIADQLVQETGSRRGKFARGLPKPSSNNKRPRRTSTPRRSVDTRQGELGF